MRASTKESLASAFVLTLSGAAYRRVQALPVVELVLAAGDVAGGNGARQGPRRRRMPSGSVPTSEHAVVPGIDAPL
jgi:hypothetical protein